MQLLMVGFQPWFSHTAARHVTAGPLRHCSGYFANIDVQISHTDARLRAGGSDNELIKRCQPPLSARKCHPAVSARLHHRIASLIPGE